MIPKPKLQKNFFFYNKGLIPSIFSAHQILIIVNKKFLLTANAHNNPTGNGAGAIYGFTV